MRPLRIIVASSGLLAACGHITHPARVLPGWSVEGTVTGIRREYYEIAQVDSYYPRTDPPPDPTLYTFQAHLRHGWKFDSGRGLQLELMVPVASMIGDHGLLFSWGDLYWQILAGGLDAGVGALVGFDPQIYAMTGKSFAFGPDSVLDLALGSRLGLDDDTGGRAPLRAEPFLTVGVSAGALRLGLFADHVVAFGDGFRTCDENCERQDFFRRQYAVGIFAGGRFGRN
jgi:hypothetical protein